MQILSQFYRAVFEIASRNGKRLKFLARSLAPLVLDSGRGPYPALEVVASRGGLAPRRARLNSRQGGAICLVIVFDNKTCKYNSFLKRNFFHF